jgi:hypothetical protein
MAVGPAQGGLEHQVQAIKSDGQRHLNATQHCGLDVIEGDLEAGDAIAGHAVARAVRFDVSADRTSRFAAVSTLNSITM